MNWYKQSNQSLVNMVAMWLQQLANGALDSGRIHSEISRVMGGLDDPQSLENAVRQGEMTYRTTSGNQGQLTPAQTDLLATIRLRISNPPQEALPQEASSLGGSNVPLAQEGSGMVRGEDGMR